MSKYTRTFKVAVVDWQQHAACRAEDMHLFFGEADQGKLKLNKERSRVAQAKAICKTCPVIQECLNHALTFPERHGVWGGMAEYERETMRPRATAPERTRERKRKSRAKVPRGF